MKKYKGKTVLLPEASSRQVLPMAKAFKKMGCEVHTVQNSKSDLGYITRYADRKYTCNGVDYDKDIAVSYYKDLLKSNQYDLVVPLSDFSAEIFAEMKDGNISTQIATNCFDVFFMAYDKLNTMKICMENDVPCPFTLDEVCSINDVPMEMNYPVIVKPRSSCGSIGLHIANNRCELETYIKRNKEENLGEVLVQEFIPQSGKQYNAHFVLDSKSNVKTAVITEKVRWFPIDGGASTLCRTIHNEQILAMCTKLLKIIGWIGYCDIDLMEDPRDGSVKVIEINARISANVKICYAAGIDIAEQLMQLYLGQEVDERLVYHDDVRLRCIHTDFLWFLKSNKRFNTTPSWFSVVRTQDQIFSWSDPFVFLVFSFQALFKYKKEMKKRER